MTPPDPARDAEQIVKTHLCFHDKAVVTDVMHDVDHCFSCREEQRLVDSIAVVLTRTRHAALEEAARIAEEFQVPPGTMVMLPNPENQVCRFIAAAIRQAKEGR